MQLSLYNTGAGDFDISIRNSVPSSNSKPVVVGWENINGAFGYSMMRFNNMQAPVMTNTGVEAYHDFMNDSRPLGMQAYTIGDSQITASTSLYTTFPERCRLGSTVGEVRSHSNDGVCVKGQRRVQVQFASSS